MPRCTGVTPIVFGRGDNCCRGLWHGQEFISASDAVEYYAKFPEHGVGVQGGQQNPDWGLLGIWVSSMAQWKRWVIDHGTIERLAPKGSRETYFRDLRELGGPAIVHWQAIEEGAPFTMPRSFPVMGDQTADSAARLAVLEATTHPSEAWIIYAYQGNASWKGRELATGVELRPPGEPIPVEGKLAGYRLVTVGSLLRPDFSSANWLPTWMASALKLKVTT